MVPTDEPPAPEPAPSKTEPPRVAVRTLLAGRSEVILEHNGEDYRLRITSRGKLILTK
jgi:hemin uptake protein HemP